jgi:hypothetical protein
MDAEKVAWTGTAHLHTTNDTILDTIHGRRADPAQTTIFLHLFMLSTFMTPSLSLRASIPHFPLHSNAPVLGSPRSQPRGSAQAKLGCDDEKHA